MARFIVKTRGQREPISIRLYLPLLSKRRPGLWTLLQGRTLVVGGDNSGSSAGASSKGGAAGNQFRGFPKKEPSRSAPGRLADTGSADHGSAWT